MLALPYPILPTDSLARVSLYPQVHAIPCCIYPIVVLSGSDRRQHPRFTPAAEITKCAQYSNSDLIESELFVTGVQ